MRMCGRGLCLGVMLVASACERAPPPPPSLPAALIIERGAPLPAALVGSRWRLWEIEGGAVPADAGAWVEIGPEGIGGTSGCNRFGMRYSSKPANGKADGVKVGDLLQTQILCVEPTLTRENRMFGALREVARLRRTGTRLEVLDRQGRAALSFVACPDCGKTP
jgi:heat shock protein HslJ